MTTIHPLKGEYYAECLTPEPGQDRPTRTLVLCEFVGFVGERWRLLVADAAGGLVSADELPGFKRILASEPRVPPKLKRV